ncbi:hypothetical protein M2164_008026 [Streptomyces sp. SAI-208]|nr:hypothetical protein [Streptomyces sp. SAI-041]MDH6572695.1 hypothetical protein [Streptomyces sp. SAI-117]MDH6582343.1 hypothetical protein [Streptomyces sp. SAI-133]MDH6612391.1 hypothetical protein [Streptomyces sp. SAI-208]
MTVGRLLAGPAVIGRLTHLVPLDPAAGRH